MGQRRLSDTRRQFNTQAAATSVSSFSHTMTTSLDAAVAAYAPPQQPTPATHDFRAARGLTPRGFKQARKRKLDASLTEADDVAVVVDASTGYAPRRTRAKHNVAGLAKSSGRAWKEPSQRASAARPATLSTPWEKKMALKAQKAAFSAARRTAVDAQKQRLRTARDAREAALARKKAAQEAAAVTQTITKTSTIKRMLKSRKQARLLKKADTTKVVAG